jgi:sigma-B regulation protein RsbU (phosphoserine phosphatase)
LGDLLLSYTDGIVEDENASGEQYGEVRLLEFISDHINDSPKSIVDSLIEYVQSFTGTSRIGDDLTMILLRRN